MTFTDKDLNRLKSILGSHPIKVHGMELSAIVDRLEAAERFINKSFMPVDWEDHPDYIAWRKAAGK